MNAYLQSLEVQCAPELASFGLNFLIFVNTCSYPLGEIVKNVLAFNFYKGIGFPDLSIKLTSPECFFPWLLLVVEQTTNNFRVFHSHLQSWGSRLGVSALGGY